LMQCRFSTLHQALDLQSQAPVVLRRLSGFDAADLTLAREQFMREGHILKRLVHRNLPQVLDVVDHEGQIYLVMQPFDGQTSDYVVDHLSGPPREALLCNWMDQVAAGLEYLHGQSPPIYYRDLSPQSILVASSDVLKLIDFGLARMADNLEQQ